MINFRYHVVSLTAVFLALAVGLVLGSTVLNGPLLDALNNQVNTLGRTNQQLREQVSALEDEANQEELFATEAASIMLDGTLTGRRVVLVVLPTGTDYAEGVTDVLELAGATVTGTVQLTEKFTHPAHRREELLDLADQALPPSVAEDALPGNTDGVEKSAALLAAVLLGAPAPAADRDAAADRDQATTEPTVPATDRRAVLSAYAAADYLEFVDPITEPAEIAVVVAGLPVTDNDATERNGSMVTTVVQFEQAGPVVVAGAGVAGEGNVVAEVRDDPTLSTTISTVDNVATPQGHTATGVVVHERLVKGTVGHYGTGPGAGSMLPEQTG